MLTVCTFLWGDKFNFADVRKLIAGVRRNLNQPHRFMLVTNHHPGPLLNEAGSAFICDVVPIANESLTLHRGCFARLRMFDPEWQRDNGINEGGRLVLIDLDTIITGPLDPLFDRSEPFVIMQKGNSSNPCPYNGALQMLRAGAHPEVWHDFSLKAAAKVPFYEFPDDQGWLWHKIPNAAGWICGIESGVFVFHKPGWPGFVNQKYTAATDDLPAGARLVTFSGWRNPRRFKHLQWVRDNWHDRAA